jgi:hypothetical protein
VIAKIENIPIRNIRNLGSKSQFILPPFSGFFRITTRMPSNVNPNAMANTGNEDFDFDPARVTPKSAARSLSSQHQPGTSPSRPYNNNAFSLSGDRSRSAPYDVRMGWFLLYGYNVYNYSRHDVFYILRHSSNYL